MTILNSIPGGNGDKIFLLILASIITAVILLEVIISILEKEKSRAIFFGILLLSCAVLLFRIGSKEEPTRYELFVSDDSIPYNEFSKHWRVIENKGNIIVAERLDEFPICYNCNKQYDNDFTILCPNCGVAIRYRQVYE